MVHGIVLSYNQESDLHQVWSSAVPHLSSAMCTLCPGCVVPLSD